jgi:signal transduction histidine kinase
VDGPIKRWLLLGLVVTAGLIAAAWSSYSSTKTIAKRESWMVERQGKVAHLDEALTMSAMMAASTGDLAWEARYREFEPELDRAIRDLMAKAPDAVIAASSKDLDAANRALVALEGRAFELVRAGDAKSASAIMFGAEYRGHKQRYAAELKKIMTAMDAAMASEMDAHVRDAALKVLVSALCLVLALVAWGRAVSKLRARERGLAEALVRSERDHAELAEAHQQLEKLHRELIAREKLSSLGLLAAGVAHEINNPMAFVTMNVQTLAEDMQALPSLPEELRIYVDELLPTTIDGIQRVNTIVRDLQQFARGDIDAAGDFDLNTEIAAAARISNNQLKGRARLDLSLGDLPPVHGKARQMTQVMVNLIVNAAHAIGDRPDGSIRVTSMTAADRAVIEVRDNGCGMSREVIERVFQPFFTTKGIGKGTGLGLSVVYGIIRDHGGSISVDSEVGVGSCFRIELPAAASELAANSELAAQAA